MSKPDVNPAAQERRFIVRAGLFVALALALGALVILLIGKERRFFDQQLTYKGAFDNVDGLQLDAPVRLGGLDVGRVSSITFAPDGLSSGVYFAVLESGGVSITRKMAYIR